MDWHRKTIDEVMKDLRTSSPGLSAGEAAKRLREHGPNELPGQKKKPPLMLFLEQFKDFMILILLGAAVISGVIGDVSDTIVIMVIVVLNAVVGFVQEFRAEKAMAALQKMAAPGATVVRGGVYIDIPASDLVPGDVVILDAGRVVPADLRLEKAEHLQINEAALTGESVPAEKVTGALEGGLSPGDRRNMAYKGTVISYGRGRGIVAATGMDTELGKIATLLRKEEEVRTPLQKRLSRFGQRVGVAVLLICAIVFGAGVLRGEPAMLMFLTAVSLAVAAIPEALPAVVTISLALGAKKMVRQNALIRRLSAVETLGSVTYICSDKTGTLTQNKMRVEEIYVNGESVRGTDTGGPGDAVNTALLSPLHPFSVSPIHTLMTALALCNDVVRDAGGKIIGDPTEIALFNEAAGRGFKRLELEKELPRAGELPFDSERKCMTTVHEILCAAETGRKGDRETREGSFAVLLRCVPASPGPGYVSFTKGAADSLIERCDAVFTPEGPKPFDREEILKENDRMAAAGLRVLGIAMKGWERFPGDISAGQIEKGLTFLGLVGMIDPPREEAREAVSRCTAAGIKAVMITGDHQLTGKSIGRRLGIIGDDSEVIITGRGLEEMSMERFEERVEHIRIYARVAPEQKLKIVKALQDRGEFVAMTGDGVNDAPALKRADIGVAMGIAGTDVAKEAADMVLLDDNFATIVKAVEEGRKIYDNIRKFVKYLLTTNSGEIWTLFLAPFIGLPVPLLPIQILWINLVTDGLPALALSAEPAEGNVMKRPPRSPAEGIFAQGLAVHVIWVGLLMAGVVLFAQAWALNTGHRHWQSMVFTILCLSQLGHVLAIRSERESLFSMGLRSNPYLLGAVLLTFILQLATLYVPILNRIFRTGPLDIGELVVTLCLSSVVFFAVEIEKMVKRRG